jgi:hypothetical protein
MNPNSAATRPLRSILAGFGLVALVSLAVGWAAGTAAAGNSRVSPAATQPSAAAAIGAPGLAGTTVAQTGTGSATTSGSAASVAYPVPGYNSLGVAPEGTILVQGSATADLKADGSNKAAALKQATDAALADAHAQASAVAASMGVRLTDIYSISAQSNTSYTYPTPDCLIFPEAPGTLSGGGVSSSDGSGAAPASSASICVPTTKITTPTSTQLAVTLVVAYKFA